MLAGHIHDIREGSREVGWIRNSSVPKNMTVAATERIKAKL